MFGQGLLVALKDLPPDYVPYDRTVEPWRLIFRDLESRVKQKVRDLLAEQSAAKIQPVEPGGYPYNGDALIAEMLGPAGASLNPPPARPPSGPSTTSLEQLVLAGAVDTLTHG